MARTKRTAFDRFLDEQMRSPSFAQSYRDARAEIDAIDHVVRALDRARAESGLTKAELAAAIDARPEVIRRLFTSSRPNPTLATLVRLAAALGYRLELTRSQQRPRGTRRRRPPAAA